MLKDDQKVGVLGITYEKVCLMEGLDTIIFDKLLNRLGVASFVEEDGMLVGYLEEPKERASQVMTKVGAIMGDYGYALHPDF